MSLLNHVPTQGCRQVVIFARAYPWQNAVGLIKNVRGPFFWKILQKQIKLNHLTGISSIMDARLHLKICVMKNK